MIGTSSILALWILAANPAGEAIAADDGPGNVVTRTAFQDSNPYRREKDGIPGLPPDATSQDGIPGLPPDAPPKREATPKPSPPAPSKQATPKPLPPPTPSKQETPKPSPAVPSQREVPRPLPPVIERSQMPKSVDTPVPPKSWFDGSGMEGWIDQGATLNTLSPRDRSNGPIGFNNRSNEYQLNQAYLRLKRDVDRDGDVWDVGGRVDLLYGTDSMYTSARGLEVTNDLLPTPKWNAQQYGMSMPQAYAEVYAPWGNGVTMKLGHFYSILGYETVAAPDNFFYSHSYAFLYGEPKTDTGILGSTRLGDFTIQAGMTRGWDNWDDNNNDLGFTGSIGWTSANQRTSIALGVDAAREQPDPNTDVRTFYSLVIQQKLGDCWQYVAQYDFGNEPGAGTDGTTANWYGLDQYLFYTINERWKAGMRFEWFRDENGSRVPGADQTADYFEFCPGVNWTPSRRVTVRPELRWDWTGTSGVYPFGDGTRSSQLMLDCDVIVRF